MMKAICETGNGRFKRRVTLQEVGQDYFAYTLKKDLPFAFKKKTFRPLKAEKESFPEKILLDV